jgi:hypothetical protein
LKEKVMAAVSSILHHSEESEKEEQSEGSSELRPAETVSPWALYGRQTIMDMRALVQRRIARR